jgi:diguanylate cyclase (GGDEF)-like protein
VAKARVLAVDDQRYFRELIGEFLTAEGFEAQTAASGEEALHILERSAFDIVLTDLVMPGMDGSELVHRVKARNPEQDIVVVTGVVDVRTAVDAMKLGASDYLLKPFDRRALGLCLEAILQKRRLQSEHARLLAENIEFMGERRLFERALGLFACVSLQPLAERIVEGLCLETQAQGGVLWAHSEEGPFELAAARGLVRLDAEPERIHLEQLPAGLRDDHLGSLLAPLDAVRSDGAPALFVPLRREGSLIGVARLTDRLEGDSFDDVDRVCAQKFARHAEVALANALRFRSLEKLSLEDPISGAYTAQYFQDVVRNEIEKANRFGRSFALLELDLGTLEGARLSVGDAGVQAFLTGVTEELTRLLRAADLLAGGGAGRFFVLLAEADALGAAVLKRRALQALGASELFTRLGEGAKPEPYVGTAVYPRDGASLEALLRVLGERVEEERKSPVRRLRLDRMTLAEGLQTLLEEGSPERAETAAQIARFVVSEVGRRPRERGLLYAAPGTPRVGAVRDGLEMLRGVATRTELVVIADGERPRFPEPAVNWLSPQRIPYLAPFVIHFGDGPAYALIRDAKDGAGKTRLFHTADRSLVEHLAFRLQQELSVPSQLPGTEGTRA